MMTATARLIPLFVAVAILSWASAYPVVRIALHDLEPVPLASIRYAIAAVLALLWLAWKRPTLPDRRDMPRILACGLVGIAAYNICFNCGETTVSSGAASLLISSAPLMAAILAVIVLGERMPIWGWVGSVISFSGVVMIAEGQAGGLSFGSGATFVFTAAVCAAIYTILQKPLIHRYGALAAIAYILIAGAFFLTPWLVRGVSGFVHATSAGKMAVIELGVFPAAVGYAAWAFVIGHMGAAQGASLLYLPPPMTFVLAYVLVGEVPSVRTLTGGAIVMAGVALASLYGRPKPVTVKIA